MTNTDWSAWHDAYARPGSGLGDRLDVVRSQIERRLDATSPDAVRVVSACAGDGRDLLGLLAGRAEAELSARASHAAQALSAQVDVRQADPAQSDVYAGATPADLVLLCGIFGNVSDADVRATVEAAPQLCTPGAEVIWTRHRRDPDLTPSIRRWFAAAGFDEVDFIAPQAELWSVGVRRLSGEPSPLEPGRHWFTFIR
ncbi:MAG: SAM-dependent methyltransferase [Mycobacteriaceae bacterium]